METAIKVFITLVLMLAVAVAIALDPGIGGRARFERSILAGEIRGCVADPDSLGRYCNWNDGAGTRSASRAY